MNCSRSKCRCVTPPDGHGCERCHRLSKTCAPGDSTRKAHAQRNNPIARIAQLEGKLDGLVSLIGSGRVLLQPDKPGNLVSPSASNSSCLNYSPLAGTTVPLPGTPQYAYEISPEEAEECLGYFRDHMLKFFAFLQLPEDTQQLREERPFLFLCVIATSSKSTQRRLALGERIKQILAQRIILDNVNKAINIDLLLGLLTFLIWGHDQLLHGTPTSLSRFMQLAMSLVFELRLNKSLPKETNMLPIGTPEPDCPLQKGPARSLEERRAVLACFVMSSVCVYLSRPFRSYYA